MAKTPPPPDRELGALGRHAPVRPQRLAFSPRGMVSTAHHRATDAGVEMLKRGGNAVDAAVAAAFALGVCEPQASGLGGQTLMLIHLAESGKTFALDGSSLAPSRATADSLPPEVRLRGYRASTVPSTPSTLDWARREYGSLPLTDVLAPAIALAEEGFQVSELLHSLIVREKTHLRRYNAGEVFLRKGKTPLPVGATLRQPALSRTLERLARHGVEDFYRGEIAARIRDDMGENHGLIHEDDLARFPQPIVRKALGATFQGRRVRTFPPPGAGRVLVEMIHVLEQFDPDRLDPDTPDGALLLAEVMRRAAIDRHDRPYEANFYAQVSERRMVSTDYAEAVGREIRRRIRRIKTVGETTHLSVMDEAGNAVALTQSIERVFGSFVMTPDLGFLYNDYMSAYEYEDITHPYFVRPNTPPWGSVAPSIVFRGKRPWLAIGSPGSERIVTAILQVLLRLRSHSPYEAVAAPRLHASVEGKLSLEASRFRDDIPDLLRKAGYTIDERDPFSFYLGCVQLVLRERDGFTGVADPRRDGSAGGPRE
ncbi:MAG: gamma-glutamyltransferase family protein [Planctomycetota bacterium JB042]